MLLKITLCAFEFLRVRNAIKHRTVICWTTLISSFAVCIHYISIVTVDTGQRWVCGIIVKCEHIIHSARRTQGLTWFLWLEASRRTDEVKSSWLLYLFFLWYVRFVKKWYILCLTSEIAVERSRLRRRKIEKLDSISCVSLEYPILTEMK